MKKSKTISTIMAASVVAGSVIPTFASEVQTVSNVAVEKSSVQVGQMSTKVIDARSAYGEALSKDEEGNIVKETIDESKAQLAKMVFDNTVAELEAKAAELYQTIEDGKIVEKPRYTIELDTERSVFKYSVTEDGRVVDNQIYVTATNNETNKTTTYIFVGVKGYDVDHGFGVEVPVESKTFDLADVSTYAEIARIQYDLTVDASKIKVEQEKLTHEDDYTAYDLLVTINLTDGTKVAELTFQNVQAFNEDEYVTLPVGGDIKGHWGEEYVVGAMLDKWVDASATFRPNDSITRAEFVKVVNRAFGIGVVQPLSEEEVSLKDLDENAWYYNDVRTGIIAGYIEGYTDGTFRPNQPITRQEAAKIIAKLHANKDTLVGEEVEVEIVTPDVNGNDVHKDTKTLFSDDSSIAVWADESVKYLNDKSVVKGYGDNTYRPNNDIKRAEAVTMLVRAVK